MESETAATVSTLLVCLRRLEQLLLRIAVRPGAEQEFERSLHELRQLDSKFAQRPSRELAKRILRAQDQIEQLSLSSDGTSSLMTIRQGLSFRELHARHIWIGRLMQIAKHFVDSDGIRQLADTEKLGFEITVPISGFGMPNADEYYALDLVAFIALNEMLESMPDLPEDESAGDRESDWSYLDLDKVEQHPDFQAQRASVGGSSFPYPSLTLFIGLASFAPEMVGRYSLARDFEDITGARLVGYQQQVEEAIALIERLNTLDPEHRLKRADASSATHKEIGDLIRDIVTSLRLG